MLAIDANVAHAALDAQAKTPYEFDIVLHIAPSRVFTPLFQEQLQRDVRNQLRLSFGALANIEVRRAHPLLTAIETKGLDQAIESWDALSNRATYFVLLDYVAGTYQIRTRFHDGMTGQVGTLTRRSSTTDRTAGAGAIARLVESSFSPVGTVTDAGKTVTLQLKGGELGVKMDRWIKPGHVFAVSRIVQENGQPRAGRIDWALLETIDLSDTGVCRCRYWHRYQEDALVEGGGTLGYRALRLPTAPGRVKVQLLDDTTLQPLDGVRVRIRAPGAAKGVDLLTNRDGVAATREAFPHLAIVQVMSGDAVRAQFPVERIEGRTAVARVKLKEDVESLAPLQIRHGAWVRRGYENVRMSYERSAELSSLLNQSLQAALDAGKKRLPALEEEIKYLVRERDQLNRVIIDKKAKLPLGEGDRQIEELRARAKGLKAFIERIENALKDASGDQALGLVQLIERARLLEADTDFAGAIRLYEQVVKASPEQKTVKAHFDKLAADWKTKNEEHAKAREFIYQTWPTLDSESLPKKLDEAKAALAACQAAGDKLTPLKLLRVNAAHTANLKKQLDTLKRRDSEDNRNKAKALGQTSTALLQLHQDAAAWVAMPMKK